MMCIARRATSPPHPALSPEYRGEGNSIACGSWKGYGAQLGAAVGGDEEDGALAVELVELGDVGEVVNVFELQAGGAADALGDGLDVGDFIGRHLHDAVAGVGEEEVLLRVLLVGDDVERGVA